MIRVLLCLWAVAAPGAFLKAENTGGERLRYEVHWGMLVAAEVVLEATREGGEGQAALELKSRGMVESLYRIRTKARAAWEADSGAPRWFEAERDENSKKRSQRTTFAADGRSGVYHDRLRAQTKRFDVPEGGAQTLLGVIYAARRIDWVPGTERVWVVCDRYKLKRVRVRVVAEGAEAAGKSGLRVLVVDELADAEGRTPKRPLHARIWIHPQGNVPELVDLRFGYGTFRMRRVG